MKPPGHAVAVLLLAAGLAGCSADKPLDPQAEAKRVAFCATVVDAIKPGDKACGPYLSQARQKAQQQQAALAAVAASRPKPVNPWGWQETSRPGIYYRYADPREDGFGVMYVWCKSRECGDIYAQANLVSIDSGVVVGWTNDTGYGEYGQIVRLTFNIPESGGVTYRLTKLNIHG